MLYTTICQLYLSKIGEKRTVETSSECNCIYLELIHCLQEAKLLGQGVLTCTDL